MGGSSSKQVVGYRYNLGVHMALAHGPLDSITEIEVDRRVAWEGLATGGSITVSAESLFGGDKREGGVSGVVDIEMGAPDQLQNSYLQSILGTDIPAFRGVACAVLNQCYMGNNPYLKPWAFEATRINTTGDGEEQWYLSKATIARPGSTFDEVLCGGYSCDSFSTSLLGVSGALSVVEYSAASETAGVGIDLSGNDNDSTFVGSTTFVDTGSDASLVDVCGGRVFYDASALEVKYATHPSLVSGDTHTGVSAIRCPNFEGGNTYLTVVGFRNPSTVELRRPNAQLRITGPAGGVPTGVELHLSGSAAATASLPMDYDLDAFHVFALEIIATGATFVMNGFVDGDPIITWTGSSQTNYENMVEWAFGNPFGVNTTVEYWMSHSAVFTGLRGGDVDIGALGRNYTDVTLDPSCFQCDDMNPAHIIRECLTDDVWGMGYSDSDIDDTAFTAAADTLHTEKMGISILWDREQAIEDFIGEMLRHIDGVLYVSRSTGQFVLKLIREEVPTITLDETNVASVSNAKRPTISELTNAVTVVYWDAETDENASTILHNEALRRIQGVDISTTIQYPGFSNRELADRVGQRDLKSLSTPLLSCEVVASRAAGDLNTGDAFVLNWPDLNINSVTMRANEIDYGDGEDNSIRIVAVQDVFTTPSVTSRGDPSEVWVDPADALPVAAAARLVTETPYYPLVVEVGDREATDILTDDADAGFLIVSAGRVGTELNADVLVDTGTGFENSATVDFHPYAQLTADISETDTALTFDGGKDLDLVETGTIAQIDDELVRIDAIDIDAGTLTVGRGILDTTPRTHADDAFILFWGEFAVSDDEQYAAAESIDVKLTPVIGGNTLAEADAPVDSVTFNSRAIRPYPPGNLQVDTASYPDPNPWAGNHTFTWAHRDRTQQTDGNLFDHATGDIGPEAGTTYRIDAFAYNASEVETQFVDVSLASVTTWTYDAALVLSDPNVSDPPGDTVRMVFNIYAVRGGYDSFQPAVVQFTNTASFSDVHAQASFEDGDGSTTVADAASGTWAVSGATSEVTTDHARFGTGSFLSGGTNAALRLTNPVTMTEGTIEFFGAAVQAHQAFGRIFQTENGDVITGVSLIVDGTSQGANADIYISDNGSSWNVMSAQRMITSPVADQFYHFAIILTGGTIYVFVDGVLINSAAYSGSLDIGSEWIFGGQSTGPSRNAGWAIDEVRIDPVNVRYNTAGFTPPAAPFPTS